MLLFIGINAKYIHTNIAIRYFYHLCKDIYPCKFLEFNINQDLNDILFRIVEENPKYIAISVYIWNVPYVKRLIEGIKKALKDAKIILGGPEVYFDSLEDWEYADFIVSGEGEQFFIEFCDAISKDKEFHIKSYNYFDMEKLPFPYKDEKIDINRVYYYETSRGCTFRCSYCLSSLDKKVRFTPLEKVFDDVKYLFNRGVRLLKFVDRTFNIDKERAIKIIEFCKRYSKDTQVHLEIEPSLLDDDIISVLNTSKEGLFRLEIGVQSFKSNTLKAIGRGFIDLKKVDKNIKKLIEGGKCILHLDLIAGLPYEHFEEFKGSLDKTILYFADEVQLGFLKLLKGTRIRNEAEVYDYKYYSFPPYEVISNRFISYPEIYRLKQMESLLDKLYNRKGLFWTLRYIFKTYKPSEVFEKLSYEVDSKKNVREFLDDLYRAILRLNLLENFNILKNLFRFDVLNIYPEDYLPEELVFSDEEKEIIKSFKKTKPREMLKNAKIGFFYFDIEDLIKKDALKEGRFIYIFKEGTRERFPL
ncbi:MAG: B12-binding domain-containing radical SAM protein [bacterium]|nr:B12-binding domain-containing radical SAM protein [bacterium]